MVCSSSAGVVAPRTRLSVVTACSSRSPFHSKRSVPDSPRAKEEGRDGIGRRAPSYAQRELVADVQRHAVTSEGIAGQDLAVVAGCAEDGAEQGAGEAFVG